MVIADSLIMKKIKLPSTTVMIIGALTAFWLADIVNPGFNFIGGGILLLIPLFMIDFLYPKSDKEKLIEQINSALDIEESSEVETQLEN